MELSFSSDRDDYDDDPTSKPALAKKKDPFRRDPNESEDEDEQSSPPPPVKKSFMTPTHTNANPAVPPLASKPNLAPIEMKKSGGGGGGFFTNPFGTKKKSLDATKPLPPLKSSERTANTASDAVTTETIQAFDPTEMELSISRQRSSESRSQSRRRHQQEKKNKKMQQPSGFPTSHRVADFAPGAIDDDRDSPRHRHDRVHTPPPASNHDSATNPTNGIGRSERKGAVLNTGVNKQLDFSSDEEEEDGATMQRARRKKDDAAGKKKSDKSSSSGDASNSSVAPSDVAPLINSVALDFVWRRWLATLLGGLQLTWSAQSSDEYMPNLPGKFIIAQLVLLVYPAVVCIIFNALYYYDVISQLGIACLISGVIGFVLHFMLHLFHRRRLHRSRSTTKVSDLHVTAGDKLSNRPVASASADDDGFELELQRMVKAQAMKDGTIKKKPPPAASKKSDPDDDDASLPPGVVRRVVQADPEDDPSASIDPNMTIDLGLTTRASLRFIIAPTPKSMAVILIRAIAVGLVMAGMTYFLEWSFLGRQYDSQMASHDIGSIGCVYLAFGWLSFIICFYSLNVRAPVEVSKYSSDGWLDEYVTGPFGRVFYVTAIALFNIVLREIARTNSMAIDTEVIAVHDHALLFFPFLPLLFAFGILPPLDSLLWWSLESLSVIFLAISPKANALRTTVAFFMHGVAGVIIFIAWMFGSHTMAMLFAIGFSFVLAWNIMPLKYGAAVTVNEQVADPDRPFKDATPTRTIRLTGLQIGVFAATIVIGIILQQTNVDLIGEMHVLHDADIAFDIIALLFAIVIYVLGEVHQPYFLFAQFRNPFYKRFVLAAQSAKRADSRLIDRGFTKQKIFAWVVRLFLVLYVAFHQEGDEFDVTSSDPSTRQLTLFAYAVLLLRCFNQIWSDHFQALVHLLLVVLINQLSLHALSTHRWSHLDWSVRFMIMGYVWQRFRYELCPKVWLWIVLTYTSFTVPKLAMRHPKVMKMICILLVPYHIVLIIFSSFLGTPILPFLGSPIFLISFPRPSRIWHTFGGKYGMNDSSGAEIENGGSDTLFYQQQFPGVYQAIQQQLQSGPLVYLLQPGDFFLLRSEPYLIWCCVLERGLGYVVIQMKGLELQTTSCHTVEALRIDENIDAILDSSNQLPSRNPLGLTYSYTPLMTLAGIKSFSITKNVLTGIIDDNDNLKLLQKAFLRAILYYLKLALSSTSSRSISQFPGHWLKPTVNNYDLQQLDDAAVWNATYYRHLFDEFNLTDSDAALLKRIALSCYAIVETLASDVVAQGGRISPAHVWKVFEGKIESSLYSDYLLVSNNKEAAELKSLVLRSYRVAVKALYDCAALGSLEYLSEDSADSFTEWHTLLQEYEEEWYIGVVKDNPTWAKLVSTGEKKMFSISRSTTEANK